MSKVVRFEIPLVGYYVSDNELMILRAKLHGHFSSMHIVKQKINLELSRTIVSFCSEL